MLKNIFVLPIAFALVLTTACTKKDKEDGLLEIKKSDGTTRKESLNSLNNSLEAADREMGKMIDEMSDMGYQNKDQMTTLLDRFSKSNDKFEKYKLCSPILMANMSYGIRAKVKKDVPELSDQQKKVITEAEAHCRWAGEVINNFESSLSDADFGKIAKDVPNSLAPLKKSIFSRGQTCTKKEYSRLLQVDRETYTNTKVLGAIMIMISVQEDGNIKDYVPNYKKFVKERNHPEKDFILAFLDHAAEALQKPRSMEQKKQSLEKATKAFSEAGIKDIPKLITRSVRTAPNCFSSIGSGVVDISKLIVTGDRMKTLFVRLSGEVKKSGNLPKLNPIKGDSLLKEIDDKYKQLLFNEKIATRDKWFRPFMVSGDKDSFKIISSGKDRIPGTQDDLTYPSQ